MFLNISELIDKIIVSPRHIVFDCTIFILSIFRKYGFFCFVYNRISLIKNPMQFQKFVQMFCVSNKCCLFFVQLIKYFLGGESITVDRGILRNNHFFLSFHLAINFIFLHKFASENKCDIN